MGDLEKPEPARQRRLIRGGVRLLAALIVAAGAFLIWRDRGDSPPYVAAFWNVDVGSALGICLLGIALELAAWKEQFGMRGAQAIAGLALLLAAASLAPEGLALDSRLDRLAMEPIAAMSVAGLALSIAVASAPTLSRGLALAVACTGLISILGHLYGIPVIPLVGSLSWPVAALTIATASGVLFLDPSSGLPAALLDSSEAGRELRRLTAAALIPALLGWLLLSNGSHGILDTGLLVIGFTLALFALSFWSYTSLRRSERARRRARSELAASELRYRRTFEHARIGIAQMAPDGRWLQVNQRLAEILGYEASELLQKTYADVSHLEDLEVDIKQWELLRRGEISDYAVERRFETKNGEIVHADVRIAREEDEAGRLRHLIVVLQDVTARKLSDGTRRVYERALAATQNGVVITDAQRDDQPIVYANPAFLALTGYTSSDVLGKNCRILNQRAREQTALEELRRAVAEGSACSVLVRNHRKSGEPFWNQLSIAPIEDASGKLTHFVGVMVDATERVEVIAEREQLLDAAEDARHEAEAANRAKDRFLSMVSHELRSPLNAILAWTSLLRDEPGDDVVRAVKAIEASVHSQTRLVNELLDASRIREGTLQIDPVRIDLEALVRNAVNRLSPIASERGIALAVETEGPAAALADAERMEQVVRNLVDNALKFTPKGGRVDVELSGNDDSWRIEVRDNGQGIGADALPHVFEEFWQGERERSNHGTGLGLGLLIVKHIVERHGGQVYVDSEGRDRGTTVRVEVPRPGSATLTDPTGNAAPDLKGVEVVVVDDDDATVQAIGLALGKAGAICRLAGSVPEALLLIGRGTPDVLVSDIGLPDRNGLDLIRCVRSLGEPSRSLLAIAVTGLVDPAERKLIRRAGFDSYMAKPVEPDAVIDRIARLRALQAAPSPPTRRVLILGGDPRTAADLATQLRKKRHEVQEVRDCAEALRKAPVFQPHLVLARVSADVDCQLLGEGLSARGVRADFVGFGDDGTEIEQKGFDQVLPAPLDLARLDRLLRFTEEM